MTTPTNCKIFIPELLRDGVMEQAAILSHSGEVRAASENFQLSEYMLEHFVFGKVFIKEGQLLANAYRNMRINPSVYQNGIRINNVKYDCSDRYANGISLWFVHPTQKSKGVYMSKTYRNIFVGLYDTEKNDFQDFSGCARRIDAFSDKFRCAGW